MSDQAVIDKIHQQFTIPVIRATSLQKARESVDHLLQRGFRVFEITLTVPDATTLARELARQPELIIGLGTVTNKEQVKDCHDLDFFVSPGMSPSLIRHFQDLGKPYFPGILTPSELQNALELGQTLLKVFPVSAVGGPNYLSALMGPFAGVRFFASGGIRPEQVEAYRQAGCFAVGMSSL